LTEDASPASGGVTLRAWSVRPRESNWNAVILLHGPADDRLGMTGYAEVLLRHGFNVLLPDARAHGANGSDLATFGLLETDDIHRSVGLARTERSPRMHLRFGRIGLGESMGAAQLLQSLRSETRFCSVAAKSPFATFREIEYDRLGQSFHAGPCLGRTLLRPIIEIAFLYARWKYRLNFEQASPEDAVAGTKVPVFLIHGQNEGNIPVRHSRLIAAHNPAVILWEALGGTRNGSLRSAQYPSR
jgi:hypothetical protein